MTRVSQPAPQPTPSATTGATPTSAAPAATSAGPANHSGNAGAATAGAPSGYGPIPQSTTPRATISGFAGRTQGVQDTMTNRASATWQPTVPNSSAGRVDRGFVKCSASAIPGGTRLTVKSFHGDTNDSVTLMLQAEVFDVQKNEVSTIALSVLAEKANLNGAGYRGEVSFDLSYDEIDAYLKQRNPNLQINPGSTTLYVSAFWISKQGNVEHRAGGPGRGGEFRLPGTAIAQSPVSAQAAAMGAISAKPMNPDIPLDLTVPYSEDLVDEYPMLKPDGSITTRLESELKGATDATSMKDAITKMYGMLEKSASGDTKEIEDTFGKGWSVSTVDRYWLADKGGANEPGHPGKGYFKGFRVDDDGLPVQDPMHDTYMDDTSLSITKEEGALRLRSNKQATELNVKPGGGKHDDKSKITQRIEVGYKMRAGTSAEDAGKFLGDLKWGNWEDTAFNHAAKEMKKLSEDIQLENSLIPWLDVTQSRHKFTIKHDKTGVEVELSFDEIVAKTLRPEHRGPDGKAREIKFYVLEGELDHLQLNSTNVSGAVPAGLTGSSFSSDGDQDTWLKNTSASSTLDVKPRLHTLEDLENDVFRNTQSYAQFEKVSGKFLGKLFPKGLGKGKQKAAYAAELLGVCPWTSEAITSRLQAMIVDSAFLWTPEMATFMKKVADRDGTPDKIAALLDAMEDDRNSDGTMPMNTVTSTLQSIGGLMLPDFKYDAAKLLAIVEPQLKSWGFEVTPELLTLLSVLDPAKIPMEDFNYLVSGSGGTATMFAELAKKHGVPEPTLTFKMSILREPILEAFEKTFYDPSCYRDLKKMLTDAMKAGAQPHDIAGFVRDIRDSGYSDELGEDFADDWSIKKPKIKRDTDGFLSTCEKLLKKSHIVVDRAMKKFLKEYITSGVDAWDIKSNMRTLGQNGAEGIEEMEYNTSVSVPELQYDHSAFNKKFERALDKYNIKYDSAMETFFFDILEDYSNRPSYIFDALKGVGSAGFESAINSYPLSTNNLSVPQLSFDTAPIIARWENALGHKMSGKDKAWAKKALKAAGADENFKVAKGLFARPDKCFTYLEKHSGISRP